MGEKGKKVLKVGAGIVAGVATIVLADRLLKPRRNYWIHKHGQEECNGESDYCPFDFCDECPGCRTHTKEEHDEST